ncbi:MAG: hypothetical protein GXO64_01155 [Candidatus Micrarchaeota archaeon]|nr:hypothetical protein [Candidatus Micrarchaeota archaeon]
MKSPHQKLKLKQKAIPAGMQASARKIMFSVSRVPVSAKLTAATALMAAGILGRVALQGIPSVEPIIAMSVIAGYFLGARYGAYVGGAGFFASNFFVWGFQGPWTIAQVAGAALAGTSASVLGRFFSGRRAMMASLALGGLLFELSVNLGTAWFWIFGPIALLTALPFSAAHMASTIFFGALFWRERLFEKLEDCYEIKIYGTGSAYHPDIGEFVVFYRIARQFRKFSDRNVHSKTRIDIIGKERSGIAFNRLRGTQNKRYV